MNTFYASYLHLLIVYIFKSNSWSLTRRWHVSSIWTLWWRRGSVRVLTLLRLRSCPTVRPSCLTTETPHKVDLPSTLSDLLTSEITKMITDDTKTLCSVLNKCFACLPSAELKRFSLCLLFFPPCVASCRLPSLARPEFPVNFSFFDTIENYC